MARPIGLRVRGADLSSTLLGEAAGIVTRDAAGAAPVERIVGRHGANHVRLRLWVDPLAGWSDLGSALLLARRARRAGLDLMVNLHYSDTWADPDHQATPAAWRSQDPTTLATTVRDYTRNTVRAFADQGTPASMVQIGNEISNGFLWPFGRIGDGGDGWRDFTTLLRAAADGVRSASDGTRTPRIVIHLDNGGETDRARLFLDRLAMWSVPYDVIGLSYYSFWHGSLRDLERSFDDLAVRFGVDILLVETAYPWTMEGVHDYCFCRDAKQLPDARRFPPTPTGQAGFFEALRSCIEGIPDGRGLGFFVWEPAWLAGVGWAPGAPNPVVNLTMFDASGRALPALQVLR